MMINCSFRVTMVSGVQYAEMDLMMMQQTLHVDNWIIYGPMMSMATASMLTSVLLFTVYSV